LNSKNIVVGREHVHVGRVTSGVLDDLDLRVIDAREVARASGLVLLGLERERVRVDTGHGVAGVVVVGLDLVEVLTLLFLETILAVEDELEGVEGTGGLLSEGPGPTFATDREEGRADRGQGHEAVGVRRVGVGLENNGGVGGDVGEVPEGVLVGGNVGEAPDKLLDGVVVREADLLGITGGDGVGTGVLDLLDQYS